MRLSIPEFRAMQSLPRRLGQRYFELPLFRRIGLDVRGRDVLEIGCGSGYGAYLLGRFQPRSYVGLDLMEGQVELARRKYPQFNFLVQDATDLSGITEESKDVVIIFGVLHHIPAWRRVIDEVTRVLKRGGGFFLEEPRALDLKFFDIFFRWGHPDTDFGLKTLDAYLADRGLTVIRKLWTPLLTLYHVYKPG